jgi:hypothetical protein
MDLDLPPLLVHRHADEVAEVGRRLLERAELEMVQDWRTASESVM